MTDPFAVSILFGSFILLLILRVPIAFSLVGSSLLTIVYIDKPIILIVERMYASLSYYPLLAIPFFILCGYLMGGGGITDRLVQFANALLISIRGGLAHVNVGTSMLFAGVSGSSTADTAAVGSILIPAMERDGYDRSFAVAITAASSTMGTIIPPSILMVVYGALAGVSIGDLFLAGVFPGLLVGLSQIAYSYFLARRRGYPAGVRPPLAELVRSAGGAALPMGAPVIIIGGIIGGFFTPTEAGVIAVAYVIVLQTVVYRTLRPQNLMRVLKEAMEVVGLPLFAIAAATLFGWLVAFLKVPALMVGLLSAFGSEPWLVLVAVSMLFLMVGMIIDGVPAMIIFLPIARAAAEAVGVPPLQLGIVIVMMASLGLITPPFGLCLLLSARIGKVAVLPAFREVMPFVLLFLAVVLLVVLVPEVALWLPQQFGGQQ